MSSKAKDRKRASLIFEDWRANLVDKDRSKSALLDNFDELFESMVHNGIEFDIAEEYLKEAIIAHQPSKYIVKYTYDKNKGRGLSREEFEESWKNLIADRAKQAFFFRYPLPKAEKVESGVSTGGGMSKDEYIRQRRYADSFPNLDLSKIPDVIDDDDDDVSFSMADLGE
jgi:hypothetical protein